MIPFLAPTQADVPSITPLEMLAAGMDAPDDVDMD